MRWRQRLAILALLAVPALGRPRSVAAQENPRDTPAASQATAVSLAPALLEPPAIEPALPLAPGPAAAGPAPAGPELAPPTGPAPAAASEEPPGAFTPSAEFQAWITDLARQHVPHEYEKRKNWGRTERTFDGVSVRLDDGRLQTHRKFKEANDGTWQMYRVRLKDPSAKFDVRIANLRPLAEGRVAMEVTAVASLEVFARQALWQKGVQLFSLSAEADARVRLWAQAEVATRLDPTRLPSDIYLDPHITAARLDIPDFRLRRVGQFSGPVVRSLSHATREALEEKIREENGKLVAALNKQIARQEKKLKLSLANVLESSFGRSLLGSQPAE
jgi:hypothetical protein